MSDLNYELPPEAIAQTPAEPRDSARLLVDRGPGQAPDHHHIFDLPNLLRSGDLLVVNDTRVLPARLAGTRSTGGAVEVLLLEHRTPDFRTWEAMVRPSAKLRVGERVGLRGIEGVAVVVGERIGDGSTREVTIDAADAFEVLSAVGEMPLPPYITERSAEPERYQTVYAERPASAAAPTAGLHLTTGLLDDLAAAGVAMARVELVVGLDTFRPVAVDDPADHVMHSEAYHVPEATWRACQTAIGEGRRVVAVGTTTVRALESAAATGRLSGRTDLFIRRPYDWKVVSVLLTNFHMPKTTLLAMIDAFVGDRWKSHYEAALADGYRFLSFGDAMLLDRRGVPS